MSARRALAIAASAAALGAAAPALLSAAPAAASTDTCVTGKASYLDKDGYSHPLPRVQVQAYDRDDDGNDDLLKSGGRTEANGSYTLCWSDNRDLDEYGGQDPYIRLIAENNRWKVRNSYNSVYQMRDDGPDNVLNGTTTNLGTTKPDSTVMGAWHAFAEVNDAWNFVPDRGTNNCWDALDAAGACRKVVVTWSPYVSQTGYHPDSDQVSLKPGDEDLPDAVVHEVGHAVMDDVYEDNAGYTGTDCTGHAVPKAMSQGCAWDEGFADWFALVVNGDPVLTTSETGPGGDLDKPHWNTADWDDGDAVEGRVAGALLDISDGALAIGSDTWDRTAEGASKIWTTFVRSGDPNNQNSRPAIRSFHQFWNQRAQDGFDVSTTGALASVYQNAIDYGYREPLADYTPLRRPLPIPDHHYTFTTNTNYWSAVALRPDADYALALYDDATGAGLSYGPQPGNKMEFIAIDSNAGRRAVGSRYMARVINTDSNVAISQPPYTIELAQTAYTPLRAGSAQTINMQSQDDVVAVRDVYVEAGKTVTIKVNPNEGQDPPEAFVMASDPAKPSTWVLSRGAAAATAQSSPEGNGAVELNYTAPRTAYYGFVLLQKPAGLRGTYTVTVS